MANEDDHHPERCTTRGRARVIIESRSAGGLSDADFVLPDPVNLLV